MVSKYEIEKFNESKFSLWKLKIRVILRKDNCQRWNWRQTCGYFWWKVEREGWKCCFQFALSNGWLNFVQYYGEEDCKGNLEYSLQIVWASEILSTNSLSLSHFTSEYFWKGNSTLFEWMSPLWWQITLTIWILHLPVFRVRFQHRRKPAGEASTSDSTSYQIHMINSSSK